jgi:hypothetical protein
MEDPTEYHTSMRHDDDYLDALDAPEPAPGPPAATVDITTVYSSAFDEFYTSYKTDRDKWDRKGLSVARFVVVGGKHCDPPCVEIPEWRGPVRLLGEPDNEHDPDAILVFYGGRPMGYLVRERCVVVRSNTWQQDSDWKSTPTLVNSGVGLYAVGL